MGVDGVFTNYPELITGKRVKKKQAYIPAGA